MVETANEQLKKNPKKSRKLIIIIGVLVILFIGGVIAYRYNLSKIDPDRRICFAEQMCSNYCPSNALGPTCDNSNGGWLMSCRCLWGGSMTPEDYDKLIKEYPN